MKLTAWAALSLVSLLATAPALADPPPGKGGGKQQDSEPGKTKGKGNHRSDEGQPVDRDRGGDHSGGHADSSGAHSEGAVRFEQRHRTVVREYYVTEFRSGHCPPGLAKKNNGCMPPGQARKWRTGHPLPRDVVFYEVPSQLVVRIGTPPPGYRYIRVASDILLIAVGTGMVIDAITDLGNL